MFNEQSLTLVVNGQTVSLGMSPAQSLVRALIVSLFTWRRADADDDLPAESRLGWWGDTFPVVANSRLGSRLWLLARSKLTSETVTQAKQYAQEALQWLVDDGVAARIDVVAERYDMQTLALGITVYHLDGQSTDVRFNDVWSFLNV